MAFKIVRNDIVKMNTEAIVNTANRQVSVGAGCDYAVYTAAGYEELLAYRREHIGVVEESGVFLTPGFRLNAKYIIHVVSPLFLDGNSGEEEKLRACYQKSLALAKAQGIKSLAFPLISTGSFGYPKEEGLRIAVDEINAFLGKNEMEIYLTVFDEEAAKLGARLYPELETYIDNHYVRNRQEETFSLLRTPMLSQAAADRAMPKMTDGTMPRAAGKPKKSIFKQPASQKMQPEMLKPSQTPRFLTAEETDIELLQKKLDERMEHMSDTFSEYLLYLIQKKDMNNVEVYKRAIVDKKIFSKIKNNPKYHPQKMTALCLCVGAKLSLDETKDLLARAGFALSPCDKTDIIFSYFIENGIYDMIELDIQLEEHGLPCVIQ